MAIILMIGAFGILPLASCTAQPSASVPPSASLSIDPYQEPPLDDTMQNIPVPDFLDQEQQNLYLRAYSLYTHTFGGETSNVEYVETFDGSFPPQEYETIEQNGYRYLVSQGRYRRWDEFAAVVQSIFTKDFWDEKNTCEEAELFTEHAGRLCFIDASKGGSNCYNWNFKDEFELIEKTETAIRFSVIGHYSFLFPLQDESFEARDLRIAESYEYTKAIPIALVLTENGWRFCEFSTASIEEGEYTGTLGR